MQCAGENYYDGTASVQPALAILIRDPQAHTLDIIGHKTNPPGKQDPPKFKLVIKKQYGLHTRGGGTL